VRRSRQRRKSRYKNLRNGEGLRSLIEAKGKVRIKMTNGAGDAINNLLASIVYQGKMNDYTTVTR
jgi:hypothetical protein